MLARAGWRPLTLYSPKCVEGAFCELLRLYRVLGSSHWTSIDGMLRGARGKVTDGRRRRRSRCDMSDRTHETIEDMLRDVRQALQMDVAFVSKFDADKLVFRKLAGDSG